MTAITQSPARFNDYNKRPAALTAAAHIAVEQTLRVQAAETVLIITNPSPDVDTISRALYDAVVDVGARPVLIYQPVKRQMDFAEPAVIAALANNPDIVISMSAIKMGKDRVGIAKPYSYNGQNWDHIFHANLYGLKNCRSFWSPSVTLDSFIRTVPIDYDLLARRCAAIKQVLDNSVTVRVQAPGGTEIELGLRGRKAKSDDGDFSRAGNGGNLPAGETFISPENGSANGQIVFDGSISLHDRDILIQEPIICRVENGFIVDISGSQAAEDLRSAIELAQTKAQELETSGGLPAGTGEIYAKNAANIGELGIGLNPAARVTGNMLEDEKAFRTCHFAVGHNYDEDAPALIHLDGLVLRPTIIARLADGRELLIERDGELAADFL